MAKAKTKKAAKRAPKKPPPEEVAKWLTIEEAAEADDIRNETGVLVSFTTPTSWRGIGGQSQKADPRFAELGIVALRIVAHDGAEMKDAIRKARKAAVRRHDEANPQTRIWRDWTKLPPEYHRDLELEIAIASLRGGDGVELHGSFLGDARNATPERWETAVIQDHFRSLSAHFRDWLIKGMYRAGAEILTDPNQISNRQILELVKKGSACGLARALVSLDIEATASLGNLSGAGSRIASLMNAVQGILSTAAPDPAAKTSKQSKSTAPAPPKAE